jgi:putative PIN family toxin of toxin-antitoxin system
VIVVLDSGIWISAFQFGGTPQAAVDSVFSNHTIAICDQIVAEVRATLVRKFSWKDEEVLAILMEYTNDAKRVAVTGTLDRVCRDPKDDMVFECAVKAEGEIILSGDNDLLSVKTFRGIQVLTVRQYLDRFTPPPA